MFADAYGDKRQAAAMSRLTDRIVACGSLVVRELGGNRKGELSAHRVLDTLHVTPGEIIRCVARRTAAACVGRRVVVSQDTTEINLLRRPLPRLGRSRPQWQDPGLLHSRCGRSGCR